MQHSQKRPRELPRVWLQLGLKSLRNVSRLAGSMPPCSGRDLTVVSSRLSIPHRGIVLECQLGIVCARAVLVVNCTSEDVLQLQLHARVRVLTALAHRKRGPQSDPSSTIRVSQDPDGTLPKLPTVALSGWGILNARERGRSSSGRSGFRVTSKTGSPVTCTRTWPGVVSGWCGDAGFWLWQDLGPPCPQILRHTEPASALSHLRTACPGKAFGINTVVDRQLCVRRGVGPRTQAVGTGRIGLPDSGESRSASPRLVSHARGGPGSSAAAHSPVPSCSAVFLLTGRQGSGRSIG